MSKIGERETRSKEIPKFLNYKVSSKLFQKPTSLTMPCHQLLITNSEIILKRDKNGKTYFLILDKDTNQVYYAFPRLHKKRQA
jgi:hypothetical protein